MAKTLKEKLVDLVTPEKVEKVEKVEPAKVEEFDPSIPENKQRHLR